MLGHHTEAVSSPWQGHEAWPWLGSCWLQSRSAPHWVRALGLVARVGLSRRFLLLEPERPPACLRTGSWGWQQGWGADLRVGGQCEWGTFYLLPPAPSVRRTVTCRTRCQEDGTNRHKHHKKMRIAGPGENSLGCVRPPPHSSPLGVLVPAPWPALPGAVLAFHLTASMAPALPHSHSAH